MKILLISYYFQPIVNARSIRWLNLCTYLSDGDNDIDVLTINSSPRFGPYVKGAEKNIPDSLNVIRTYPGLLHHLLLRGQSVRKGGNSKPSVKSKSDGAGYFRKMANWFWKNVFQRMLIPDHFIDWIPIASVKGWQLSRRKNGYDVIISASNPVSDHLVGYIIKLFNKRSIWIAEYGDPWSFYSYPPRSKLLDKLNYAIEKLILKKVNCIVATTEETCDEFLKCFKFLDREQVVCIPQGTDTDIIEKIDPVLPEKFTIGYIGRFDPIRDPTVLFESFRVLLDQGVEFNFVMAGSLQDKYAKTAEQLRLGSAVRFLGHKSHLEALEVAKSCHVLLYYGNISTYQLPSKIWEYLALRRPILCVHQISEDIGANIVKKYKRGLLCKCSSDSIAAATVKLQEMFSRGELDENFNLEYLAEADWRTRAAALEQLLHDKCRD